MERFRGRAHALPDKDDASTVELLPIESLPDRPSVRHGEDSVQEPWHNQTPAIKGWPQTPKRLKKKWQREATLVVDIIVALVPLLFIVLSIATIRLSGSPTSSGGHRVKSATTLGPTLFPVTFAAIVGRSLKALASYQAERGAKLGRLEQMIGSLTMFGAIELQVLLRTFDLVGVCLVLLWALSPLGGQASLRLLDTGEERAMTVQTLRYLNPDSMSILGVGADTFEALGFLLNSLYLSALLIPPAGQAASMDPWGNIKIPRIEHLEEGFQSDVDGWFTVSAENASYSSLVGLPIAGIPTAGSSSFSVQSYYMIASCTNASGSVPYPGAGGFTVNVTGGSSINWPLFPYQEPYPDVKPRTVSFESGSVASDFAFTTQCLLTRSSVELNVTCDGRSCGVANIRRSKFDQRPPGYTPLYSNIAASIISSSWPTCANSVHHPDYSTPTEYYLSDPTLKGLSDLDRGISLIGMAADVFSERFSLLLNTYWQCSLVPWYLTGNFPANESLPSDIFGDVDGAFNTTTVTITNATDIYICNKTWAMILVVASSTLLLFGLYGAVVKHRTRGPQVLGYVSSMTRDNPYVNLPPGGCALDGLERTRLLKDVEVRLRDVAPRRGVGHIALSDAGPSDGAEGFAFGRLYAGTGVRRGAGFRGPHMKQDGEIASDMLPRSTNGWIIHSHDLHRTTYRSLHIQSQPPAAPGPSPLIVRTLSNPSPTPGIGHDEPARRHRATDETREADGLRDWRQDRREDNRRHAGDRYRNNRSRSPRREFGVGGRREDNRRHAGDRYRNNRSRSPRHEFEFGGRRANDRSRSPRGTEHQERRREDERRDRNGTDTYFGPAFKKRGKEPGAGTDTYHGSAHKQRKNGNLDPEYGKTKGAMRVVLSHWLKIQYDGYQGASMPKDWDIKSEVLDGYLSRFSLPVHCQHVYDLRAEGESAAQCLHQSWQKPKEEVHRYWRRHGVVLAPTLDFFLQSFADVDADSALIQTQAPSDSVQQEIAGEELAAAAKPRDQQSVQQVQQVQTESIAADIAAAQEINWTDSHESSQDGGQKGQCDDGGSDEPLVLEDQWPVSDQQVQTDSIAADIAAAEKTDWTDSYESSQDGGQKVQPNDDGSDEPDDDGSDGPLVSEERWPGWGYVEGNQKGQSDEEREGDDDSDNSDEPLFGEDEWPVSDYMEGGQKGQNDDERKGDDDSDEPLVEEDERPVSDYGEDEGGQKDEVASRIYKRQQRN